MQKPWGSVPTAWRHYKAGKIPYPTQQLPTGTVIIANIDQYASSRKAHNQVWT
ncbi:hypothetical protein [Nodularia sphaerocarpa]|uniref:hypothetical protein n=1 Tax=Nodularia sphaerocarpa TaxID=137816 RepID=UPI001EFAF5DA|nr:hypothetical protein [Nodularia sphaerocarpa]MDB9373331.1 hypothetical protein [Nodularia sphaerocarpa CS-585]MDB9378611.1 hypothetical protein [Nodularia sphaerocarpa CS-585A2]ULP70780.1 hypothetical protein BDGGKGIB_00399 [Nodularia sphaerocarpa UHCC 0038]